MDPDEKEARKQELEKKLFPEYIDYSALELEFSKNIFELFHKMQKTMNLQKYFESHNLPKLAKMMKKKYKAQEKKVKRMHEENDRRNAIKYHYPTIEEKMEKEKLMNEYRALFD